MPQIINAIHAVLFLAAFGYFIYAVLLRKKLIARGQPDPQPADLSTRLRSVLHNVIAQETLFRRPLRGLMHAFIFYGFVAYALHTLSQMVAGLLWTVIESAGMDPYSFRIPEYLQLFHFGSEASVVAVFVLLVLVYAFTVFLHIHMADSVRGEQKRKISSRFAIVIGVEFAVMLFYIATIGTRGYEAIVQYFSVLVLIGLAFFAGRRWIFRRPGLDFPSLQSIIVIALIAVLMISTLIESAAHAFLTGIPVSIINAPIMQLLQTLGMDSSHSAELVRQTGWWVHLATVYAFMFYVPNSKHAHLIFAPMNYFYRDTDPSGKMTDMDLESEDAVWGAASASELRRSSLLDSISCIECGRCTILCPANRTGKPLDPKKIMVDVKHSLLDHASELLKSKEGENAPSPLIGEGLITEEELWACTSCYACATACPVGNDQWESIYQMRRHLAMNEMSFEQTLQGAFVNMENQSNPWGVSAESRADWASGLDVPVMAEKKKADVLYWVGCAGAFDERNKEISRSMVQIFQKAGVDYAILGQEENCTGDSARRAGNEYLFQMLAQTNVETLGQYEFNTIVTQCPHCFNTLQNEYPSFGGNYRVVHHSEYINELHKEGKISMDSSRADMHGALTYHDSCYLGRYNDLYEDPRRLVSDASGIDVHEAADHHDRSTCCGAGGAQMWMEEKYDRVNRLRGKQLVDTGAQTVATACPFCMIMLSDGVKSEDPAGKTKVLDVAEIVVRSLDV